MGRWIGVDYGTRRTGLALSDPGGRIASPAAALATCGIPSADAQSMLSWACQQETEGIVVGLPLNMDGSCGAQAKLSKELAEQLRRRGELPVELWDERLTSFQADQLMAAGDLKPARRKRIRDALAAQLILQSFLDARRAAPRNTPGPPPAS